MKQVKARDIHTALAAGTTRGGSSAPPTALAAPPPQRHSAPGHPVAGAAPAALWAACPSRRTALRRPARWGPPRRSIAAAAGRRPAPSAAAAAVPGAPSTGLQLQPVDRCVHAYTMPVPRAHASTLPVPRPPAHQAYYAALQPYGGYPLPQLSGAYGLPAAPPPPSPALPPAPWDPVLLSALHTAPTSNNYTGGGDWYIDTRATPHMFAHPVNLASFTPVTTDRRIIVDDGSTLPITHDARTRMVLHRCDSLDELYPVHPPSTSTTAPVALSTVIDIWHARLGHPNPVTLRHILRSFSFSCNKIEDHTCHVCRVGKHVRLPFNNSTTIAYFPFQLIHSVVWTSLVPSNSDYLYYLVILDDYSHYMWTFPLRRKSDALSEGNMP
ncbi:transcription initiation factor TFIID subunit 4 [Triticum aestivum]|uniref:transcription initiation factor TFIID subunit 4 n=1 Tax=Triticum aestivum TaxID=4565 RepID=UPI001D030DCF|nr:transcription initiation factor TFIID subunit 4-like [Triticum aestivum]